MQCLLNIFQSCNSFHCLFVESRALLGTEVDFSCEVWIGWGDSTIANISWATSINNGTQSKLNSSDNLVGVTQAKSQSGLSVISSLKIAQLREEDGGEYFCLNEDDPTKKSAEVLSSKYLRQLNMFFR